jgi:hypothetical protein
MEVVPFSLGGIFYILMLIGGIILSVITARCMFNGQLSLPGWGKVFLCIGMIAMLVILFLGILPTHLIEVENPFVESQTHIVFPDPSMPTEVTR